MKDKKSFLFVIKRVVMCLLVVFMVQQAVTPAPAQAGALVTDIVQALTTLWGAIESAAKFVMTETALGRIITQFVELYTMLQEKFELFTQKLQQAGVTQMMAKRLLAEVEVRNTDAIIAANAASRKAAVDAAYIAKHAAPPHQELCKSILVHQLVSTTEDFEREVSRIIAEGVSNRGRCPGCNENGGARASAELQYSLERKYMDPLDGVPRGLDNSTTGTAGSNFHGADKRPVSPLQIYEMPAFEEQVYTDPVTNQTMRVRALTRDPINGPQKFFIAAVNSLYHMAGARPTPLTGAQMFTPKGLVQRAMFNHCAANENALIKQCSDRLAYYTRPNSLDANASKLRDAQNARCEAITGTIDKKRFGDCKAGLSPYETQLLTLLWCQSIQQSAGMKMAGATDKEVGEASELCSMSWSTWRAIVAQKDANCTKAQAAIASLGQCWNAVNALGPKGEMANVTDNPEYLARWRTQKNTGGLGSSSYMMEIKATKLKQDVPQGQPTSLDEVELPFAVGQ